MHPITITAAAVVALTPATLVAQQTFGPTLDSLFRTGDVCIACHNDLTAASGADVSIGYAWRSSMMGNAARDPYWHAAVRRETLDHPSASSAIEDKCATCHMPMARYIAHTNGAGGEVFAHLAAGPNQAPAALLAADGVSCTVCHQIDGANLNTPESFTGGFRIRPADPLGSRAVYGPFTTDTGRQGIMRSASGFEPNEASHIQSSELCGSCHTLFTHALNEAGEEVGELPEQAPYLEWLESDYPNEKSCQDCHMPEVDGRAHVTGVLPQPRERVSQHVFRGGNFFMPRLLNRYRDELGVSALPQELEATALRSMQHLETSTSKIEVKGITLTAGRLDFQVAVHNLAGHKFPTAYPSRRAWLHVSVEDRTGRLVFESGAVREDGSIVGNDNDLDAARYEPHHAKIEHREQVQIYEAIMEHYAGGPTTGLLNGVGYLKDNRLLPRGFDKNLAGRDVAVFGGATGDVDFQGGGDQVPYSVSIASSSGPYSITAELLYQPIAYRWVENLKEYDAQEPKRFVEYYQPMAASAHHVIARAVGRSP